MNTVNKQALLAWLNLKLEGFRASEDDYLKRGLTEAAIRMNTRYMLTEFIRDTIEEGRFDTAVSQPTASSAVTNDVGIADPYIVKQLTGHLLKAYDDFINSYPGTVDYVDGFMAAHNVHRWIVLHLEEVTKDEKRLWRKMAVDTFKNAMDNPEGKGDPT